MVVGQDTQVFGYPLENWLDCTSTILLTFGIGIAAGIIIGISSIIAFIAFLKYYVDLQKSGQ